MCGSRSQNVAQESKVATTTTMTKVGDIGLTGKDAVDAINLITRSSTDASIGAFNSLDTVANTAGYIFSNLAQNQRAGSEGFIVSNTASADAIKGISADNVKIVQTQQEGFNRLVGGANDFVLTAAKTSSELASDAKDLGLSYMAYSKDAAVENNRLTETTIARAQSVSEKLLDQSQKVFDSGRALITDLVGEARNLSQDFITLAAGQTNEGASAMLTKYIPWILITIISVVGVSQIRRR